MDSIKIIHGDCIKELAKIKEKATLIFADPPYNFSIDYGNGIKNDSLSKEEYLDFSSKWLTRSVLSLKENGSIWIVCPDEWVAYISIILDSVKLHRRNWIKWYETFGVNCKKKFNRCSRHILYYVKNERDFIFNSDNVLRPSDRQLKYNDKRANSKGKLWDDVWQIPRLAGTHKERVGWAPTQLPLALVEPIIKCATNEGDLVIDPFSGSGTTGLVCKMLGRRYVGIEQNEEYCVKSLDRIKESKNV